jgi:translation initiation factor 1
MDLEDQLRKLFPDHPQAPEQTPEAKEDSIWKQDTPIECRYEKRQGKVVTILAGYTGANKDFRALTSKIKKHLGVGGSWKNDHILIQGDYRDEIMAFLKEEGFRVKRVGG